MSKLCLVCSAENRDEAQFCRACGTSFAAVAAPEPATAAVDAGACRECGFRNDAGVRWCANCGAVLAAVDAEAGDAATPSGGVAASPPPLSYPTFAPVAPYPPAPAVASAPGAFPPLSGDASAAEPPEAEAPIGAQHWSDPGSEATVQQAPYDDGSAVAPTVVDRPPSRWPLIAGIVAIVLAAGIGAWYLAGGAESRPVAGAASSPAAPASVVVAPPAPPPQPSAPVGEAPPPLAPPPMTASPLPQIGDPTPVAGGASGVAAAASDPEALRLAAERRRERLAKEKAEREAKAKAIVDAREQEAAAATARQPPPDAGQRRPSDDATARRPTVPAPAPPPPSAQLRTVSELCAGRGTIARAICESRTCGEAQHANEPLCRQIRENDERRRNYNN